MYTFLLPSVSGLSKIGIWLLVKTTGFAMTCTMSFRAEAVSAMVSVLCDHKAMIDRIAGVPDPSLPEIIRHAARVSFSGA
jgi:hypothetical protein